MENDIRGIDLKADNFKNQLIQIISGSNLPSSLIMYILKDMLNEVSILYTQSAAKQYEDFCIAAQQEQENAIEENVEQE